MELTTELHGNKKTTPIENATNKKHFLADLSLSSESSRNVLAKSALARGVLAHSVPARGVLAHCVLA